MEETRQCAKKTPMKKMLTTSFMQLKLTPPPYLLCVFGALMMINRNLNDRLFFRRLRCRRRHSH